MIKNTDEFPNTVCYLPFISMPTKVKGIEKQWCYVSSKKFGKHLFWKYKLYYIRSFESIVELTFWKSTRSLRFVNLKNGFRFCIKIIFTDDPHKITEINITTIQMLISS